MRGVSHFSQNVRRHVTLIYFGVDVHCMGQNIRTNGVDTLCINNKCERYINSRTAAFFNGIENS